LTSDYRHVKGQNSKSGSKLQPLINVSRAVMVNFRTQFQEYIEWQEDQLGN